MPITLPLLCFFLSGAAGLIAEICWVRRASLVFGSTVYALSTVLAVFFAGLAAGNLVFGRRSPRITRPLRLYVLLELALAATVIASLPLLQLADTLFGYAYRSAETPALVVAATRFVLVGCVIFVPTFLMGGTLPLFCRQFVTRTSEAGRIVALLYGTNTVGAAAGAGLCGFVLLPALGLGWTVAIAAALDVVVALLAGVTGWTYTTTATDDTSARAPQQQRTSVDPAAVAVVFFLTGFVAVANEVVWTRFLALIVRTTVFTYTATLTITLLGIALGSGLVATLADRAINHARLLGTLLAGIAIAALAVPLLPPTVWTMADLQSYVLLLLPPATLSGAALPLAVRLVLHDPRHVGAAVGLLTATNTLGGIAGSLLVGFVALPRLGLHTTLVFTSGCALLAAGITWWRLDQTTAPIVRAACTIVALGLWLALPRVLPTQVPQDYLAPAAQLVDYREGLQSNLAVVRRNQALHLEADRWWQGQDQPSHQMLAAHIPLLLHNAPHRVLVVGVGAGQTPAHALAYDIARLDCVDIEPVTFALIRAHFAHEWMDDPRVRLLREDGRTYLAHTAHQYDVISLEVGQLFRPGIADFYTADFYRQARARLAPSGILSQFVPLPFLTAETFRQVVATFTAAFPQSVLWYNTSELLLLGINADSFVIRAERLDQLQTSPAITKALRYRYWGGPAYQLNQPSVFLAGFLIGPRGLAALASGASIESDDRPTLPYTTRMASPLDAQEISLVDLLRGHLDVVSTVLQPPPPPDELAQIADVRERNLGDIVATALLRRVDYLLAQNAFAALDDLLAQTRAANPESIRAWRLTAEAAMFQGKAADAERDYRHTLSLDPDDARAHLGLARLLHAQQRAPEAVEHYRASLRAQPGDAATYTQLGGALAQAGDTAAAEQSFAAAVAADPTSAEAHNNLAVALSQRGDVAAARRHLEEAVRLRPDYVEARRNLEKLRAKKEGG